MLSARREKSSVCAITKPLLRGLPYSGNARKGLKGIACVFGVIPKQYFVKFVIVKPNERESHQTKCSENIQVIIPSHIESNGVFLRKQRKQKPYKWLCKADSCGGDSGIRTHDLLTASQAL